MRETMVLAARWWTLVLRGIAGILFGILTFMAPGASLHALVLLFGCYAIANGVINLVFAGRGPAGEKRWGALLLESVASIAAGVLTLLWPGITALALLFFIAAWAIVTGIAQIAAAIRLRRRIRGEWLLAASGVLSVAFGAILFVFPGAGALAVVVWIGAYAIVLGAFLIALGLRLRRWARSSERELPAGGLPAMR